MASFRDQIKPKHGEIWAHVFENKSAGVPRNVYWSLNFECEPINWDASSWDCNVQCEWLTWPLRQWADLHEQTLRQVTHPNLVECSFYFSDHHPVTLSDLAIQQIANSTRFLATLKGQFDLRGFGHLDESGIPLALACELDFRGVVVVPGNLSPKPTDAAQARDVVEPFLSTADLQKARWDKFRYMLEPRS